MKDYNYERAELGEKNIFEEIFELLERHRLRLENDFPLGDFYDIVNNFEKTFEKFNSDLKNDQLIIREYNLLLNETVGNFLVLFRFKGFKKEPIFYAFKRFIAFFSKVLKEANNIKNLKHLRRNFFENFPSLEYDITEFLQSAEDYYINGVQGALSGEIGKIISFEHFFPIEIGIGENQVLKQNPLTIYCNDYVAKTIIWDETQNSYIDLNKQFYLFLDIHVKAEPKKAADLFLPFWLITSALEGIQGVTVEIDEITKGTLFGSFKVWMKNLISKEETKIVIEAGKELAAKTLSKGNVSYSGIKKARQETKNLEAEIRKLDVEINQMPSDSEATEARLLDLQRKKLENEKLQIENANAKIELVEKLSGLVAKGIIEPDEIEIKINDILYILKERDNIKEIGPDISEIT
jgi:hypothetical protein